MTFGTVWAGGAHDGGHDDGGHWMAPQSAQTLENPVPKTKANLQAAAALFQQNCMQCHGATGEGNGPWPSTFPSLPQICALWQVSTLMGISSGKSNMAAVLCQGLEVS